MRRPWLSVVMPTYNGAAFLTKALASVASQSSSDVELIAVDDGSTDDTLQILRTFSMSLPMTVVERTHSGNWVACTNAGMQMAKGEYICWLHQDDVWRPNRLRILRALTRKHPTSTLFVHPCWYCRADGRRVGYWRCPLPARVRPFVPREVIEALLIQCWIASCGTLFRADAAERAGPLDERYWYSADWDYWLRLARTGTTVYCPLPLASFRLHAGSQTISRIRHGDVPGHQQSLVLDEHLGYFARNFPDRPSVAAIARFSAAVNLALAHLVNGNAHQLSLLARDFFALGPEGWRRYLTDSCILERCASRLLAGVLKVPGEPCSRVSENPIPIVQPPGIADEESALARGRVKQCTS